MDVELGMDQSVEVMSESKMSTRKQVEYFV